jgi:hypothetical protein
MLISCSPGLTSGPILMRWAVFQSLRLDEGETTTWPSRRTQTCFTARRNSTASEGTSSTLKCFLNVVASRTGPRGLRCTGSRKRIHSASPSGKRSFDEVWERIPEHPATASISMMPRIVDVTPVLPDQKSSLSEPSIELSLSYFLTQHHSWPIDTRCDSLPAAFP